LKTKVTELKKNKMKVLIIFASIVGLTLAQFPNGRILEPPVPEKCAQRIIHERAPDGKGYFFSWREPALQGIEEDWLGARNFCRERCMDSVSLENSPENEWVKQRIVDGKVSIQN
jgi:hypothetical protein